MMNRILQNRYIDECAWNSGFQKHYLQVTDVESYVQKLQGYAGDDWQQAVASTTFKWNSKIYVALGVALYRAFLENFMQKLFLKISDIDGSVRYDLRKIVLFEVTYWKFIISDILLKVAFSKEVLVEEFRISELTKIKNKRNVWFFFIIRIR